MEAMTAALSYSQLPALMTRMTGDEKQGRLPRVTALPAPTTSGARNDRR